MRATRIIPSALRALTREASSMVEVLAEENGQQIGIDGDRTIIVSADRLILRQAIVNLLDNAIKHSAMKSQITADVGSEANNWAALDITDQGPGISGEHQPYVFDRFYRVDKAKTREWGGAGLGLSIARWAVEAHRGELALKSEEGHGSTFRIFLPPVNSSSSNQTKGGPR